MTDKEKLCLLEEALDVEKDSLNGDIELDQISQWDSMAVITVIAMIDDVFGKAITPAEVKGFKTIKDIMDVME